MIVEFPLCVDLDGTLRRGDCLLDGVVALANVNVAKVLLLPFWLCRGLPYLKFRLSSYSVRSFQGAEKRWNSAVIDFVSQRKSEGAYVMLVTGSHRDIAESVRGQFGFFDEAVGTEYGMNLVGAEKAKYLIDRFGKKGFDYIGDSLRDIPVWKSARNAYCVRMSSISESSFQKAGINIVWIP
jgi:phosphoserine phosphatase